MILYKSNKSNKKWAAFFPDKKKVIHFGQKPYRDFTLMNDKKSVHYLSSKKERDSVKKAYQSRHANDNLSDPESAGALSWFILWTAPTLKGGIINYAREFNLRVIDKTRKEYSPEVAKKLISG
mgnify:CR=1 FL=1